LLKHRMRQVEALVGHGHANTAASALGMLFLEGIEADLRRRQEGTTGASTDQNEKAMNLANRARRLSPTTSLVTPHSSLPFLPPACAGSRLSSSESR
jgi:hypothetical protein